MKILVDTNVVLDVLCNRKDFVATSEAVWKYCEVNQIDGYISAVSVPNIVYILRKELTMDKTKELINQFNLIFKICDLRESDILKAANLMFPDYEDALQSVCAERLKAQFIVTRNIRDFLNSKIPAITPEELLARIR